MESLKEPLLMLNRAYQEAIQEKLQQIDKLLEDTYRREQQILIEKASAVKGDDKKSTNGLESVINKVRDGYFKYRFGSTPPDDVDTKLKKDMAIYDTIPQFNPAWTQNHRNKLKRHVIADAIRILTAPINNRLEHLQEKRLRAKKLRDEKMLNEVKKSLKQTEAELESINEMNENEILKKVDPEKIDWFKVAKILNGSWSANECRLVWVNVCNPSINQQNWTHAEDKKLISLARKYREKNWDKIAEELNTNRSAYLCAKRYHEKTVGKYCRRDWTTKESNELLKMVEKQKIGHYVPYNYLSYLNGTRDRNSLYTWYSKINPNINHGKWSIEEELALEEALKYYNHQYNWQTISEFVATRTPNQCKERYELKFHHPEKYINWSVDEDKKLLELYEQYPNQWVKLAVEFEGRTDHSCLSRYNKLMNWKRQHSWFENQPDEIREFLEFACKGPKEVDSIPSFQTDEGETIPRMPKFQKCTSIMNGIIDKIYQKKNLVVDFVREKREGKLNITLLEKIGIKTHVITSVMKQMEQKQRSLLREQMQAIVREEIKRSKIAKPIVPKERKKRSKQPLISDMIAQEDIFKNEANLSQLNMQEATTSTQISDESAETQLTLPPQQAKTPAKEPNEEAQKKSVEKKRRKLRESSINLPREPKKKVIETPSEKTGDETKIPKKRGRKRKSEISTTDATVPKAKIARKEKLEATSKENTSKEKTPKEKTPNGKIAKEKTPKLSQKKIKKINLNQTRDENVSPSGINGAIKTSILSVPVNEIDDNYKIPCLVEEGKCFFKYIYSVKKDSQSTLRRFSLINCKGRVIAVKALNLCVNNEYLTEERLDKMSTCLEKALGFSRIRH